MAVGTDVCVIEPHSDDAFLSIGGSIRYWLAENRRVEIVTVFSTDERRADHARRWTKAIGAEWTPLGREAAPSMGLSFPEARAALDAPLLEPRHLESTVTRIWPLGIEHPEHKAVAAHGSEDDLYYVDMPYHLSLTHQDEVRSAILGRSVEWWLRPGPEKWDDLAHYDSTVDDLAQFFPGSMLEGVTEVVVSGTQVGSGRRATIRT